MQILERKFPKKEWRSISDAEDNESIIYDNDYTCVSIRVGFYLNHLLFIWKAESESESKRKWARGRGKERKRESPFTESNLNTFNGRYCWSGRTGGPGTQFRFFMWVAGTQVLLSPDIFIIWKQGSEVKPGLEDMHSDMESRYPKRHPDWCVQGSSHTTNILNWRHSVITLFRLTFSIRTASVFQKKTKVNRL